MVSYKESGVDIDAGNEAVNRIKDTVKSTYRPEVSGSIGGFAAGFNFDPSKYEQPILVSCTDGVGTKLRLAIEAAKYDSIGIDLVAMCVNDLICMGAEPLFFLDYYACHKIDPNHVSDVIDGIADGCRQSGASLIGGEMAEMNDMYREHDFDLAGFCVGVVDKPKVIDGSKIEAGQHVYALKSAGVHSNGYSLVRKIYDNSKLSDDVSLEDLLIPTRIYVKEIQSLMQNHDIRGIAHITGGGLAENIERILPDAVNIQIQKSDIRIPDVFKHIQTHGDVPEEEMFRVFNMGVGMVVISPDDIPETDLLYKIGQVNAGEKGVQVD